MTTTTSHTNCLNWVLLAELGVDELNHIGDVLRAKNASRAIKYYLEVVAQIQQNLTDYGWDSKTDPTYVTYKVEVSYRGYTFW